MASTQYIAKGTTNLTGTYTIANGDTLYFSEGGQLFNAGMDVSAVTAMAAVYVEERCAASIDPTVPLKIGATLFRYAGGGTWYVQAAASGGNTITTMWIVGAGRMNLVGSGTVTNCEGTSGYLRIADTALVTNLRCSGMQIDQFYNATANTDWIIEESVFRTERGFSGNAWIRGGSDVYVARQDTSATTPTGGVLYCESGRVVWHGGNITSVHLGSKAVLDLGKAPNNLTITNLYGSARAISRSILASKYSTVTITNTFQYGGQASAQFAANNGVTIGG